MDLPEMFGEPISIYTRKQAIEDGVLVDLSRNEVIEREWAYPFACTASVWEIVERALKKEGQDLNGILHDISHMARLAARKRPTDTLVFFAVLIAGKAERFKLHVGPDDFEDPVFTLMRQNED